MPTHRLRRVALGALALLTTLTVVAPVEAREPLRKIEPRRTVPYRVGRAFTPNTDVVSVSGYAAWMIDEALGATTPLPRLGAAFMRVERAQGINARYFVAHAMLESGWGTSDIARYKRNLFGYNAYDRDPWKHARRFATHARGVATVAEILRRSYLTPGGMRWYGFTTLRAINRYYASDVRWADKVAVLANVIDELVVTLRERRVRFHLPLLASQPVVGAPTALDIPWSANPGAELPAALRFAARWTPIAVVESSPEVAASAPDARWRWARRTDGPDHLVQLTLQPPTLPGTWRLDVEARDSDGATLPPTDRPTIRSLEVRVAAPGEIGVALAVDDAGGLAGTVSVAGAPAASGPAAVELTAHATAGGVGAAAPSALSGATLEVWTLPLDPTVMSYVTFHPLPDTLGPSAPWVVSLGDPAVPAVVVARIAGGSASTVRAVPTVVLTGRDEAGRLALASPAVASPRDAILLGREAATGPIALRPLDEPGSIELDVAAANPAPAVRAAVAAVEDAPGPHSLLVRTVSIDPASQAGPSDALVEVPGDATGPTRLVLSGLPAGVRLVMAGLVPRDGGPVDPATVTVAWIAVTAMPQAGAAPN